MVERPIRVFGDPVLTTVTDPIGVIDDGVRALVQDLLDTVALPGRAGVAPGAEADRPFVSLLGVANA